MTKGKGKRATEQVATGTPDVPAVAPLPDPSPATPTSFVGLLREHAGNCAAEAAKAKDFRVRRVWMSRKAAFDWLASSLAQ